MVWILGYQSFACQFVKLSTLAQEANVDMLYRNLGIGCW